MECEREEYDPMGRVPECGAIFMANVETKEECLKMDVFALPSSLSNFVKQVKAGMLLFLFEYENRQLFGVYRAITDGGVNILSQKSCSSLKQYPAQVCFAPLWFCDPLHEKEFQDAIRENYFSKNKFNFGLSKDQVRKLLQLFSSRKLKNELQPKQLRDDGESLHDLRHKLDKKFDAENLECRNVSPDLSISDQGHFADRCKEEDNGESFHDLRHKLNKKFDAGNLEGRNSSPDLLISDQGHLADRCKEEDTAYQCIINVTDRHNTSKFGQNGLPDNIGGSLSNKRRKEDDERNLVNLKDHQCIHHNVPGRNFGGDTLDSNKGTKKDDDRYFMNFKDQRLAHHDVTGLNFPGKSRGDTLDNNKRRAEEDGKYLMTIKDQRPVYHDDIGRNFCGEYRDGSFDSNKRKKEEDVRYLVSFKGQQSVHHCVSGLNFSGDNRGDTLDNNKRRKDDDGRYLMNIKDQQSVDPNLLSPNFSGEYCCNTLDKNKIIKEEDRYLMNSKDQRSVYHEVSTLNFGREHCGDTLDKLRQSSNCDELLVSGKVQYEDHGSTLAVGKYLPVRSDMRVAGNDLYTFVDRVVADCEHDGRPSSNSPHTCRETFEFGAKGLSDDKFFMNLGSKRTYKLFNSHQDALPSEINGDTKCSKPDSHYPLNDTKCSTQDMQNMDIHRPDIYSNSASVFEGQYRPCKSSRFESETYLGASLESDYSFGKSCENAVGCRGVTDDGLYPVMDGRLKADHSGEPVWLTECHCNSGRSYIPSRRSFGDRFGKHNQVEGEPAMDSFHNSVTCGFDASFQPNEDQLVYSEGSSSRNQNHLSDAPHFVHTYPSYHESVVTKSVPCDSDLKFSHPDPSSSRRVCSSSSLLRGIAPYKDSGEPHVSNNRSLLNHPEENHSSKFCYIDLKRKDKVQYSCTSANQDFYLADTSKGLLHTGAAEMGEIENGIPTNCRSPLFGTSPSSNRRLLEDVDCREENVQNHASSLHKNLSVNYFDSVHPSSSSVCERAHIKGCTAGYRGGNDLTNYDPGRCTSQGQVTSSGNDNAEHPLNASGIHKSNRRSVFARLSSGPEISSREKLDADRLFSDDTTVDEVMGMLPQDKNSQLKKQGKLELAKHDEELLDTNQMLKSDAYIDEAMSMLPLGKKSLFKKPGESRMLARQPDEEVSKSKKKLSLESPVEHGHLMMGSLEQDHSEMISAKISNDVNQADGEGANGTLRETRLVDFKRRSEEKRNLDGSTVNRSDKALDKRTAAVEGSMGNKTLDSRTAGAGTMLSTCKRRKLVRPVFVKNESAVEGMEDKPKMHVPAQSPDKDAP